jgi:hypothetical protein
MASDPEDNAFVVMEKPPVAVNPATPSVAPLEVKVTEPVGRLGAPTGAATAPVKVSAEPAVDGFNELVSESAGVAWLTVCLNMPDTAPV